MKCLKLHLKTLLTQSKTNNITVPPGFALGGFFWYNIIMRGFELAFASSFLFSVITTKSKKSALELI